VLDVRRLVASLASTLALGRGLLGWNREQQFCGACGQPAESERGGVQRRCTGEGCGRLLFPRIEPAVIALVESPGEPRRCLLARAVTEAITVDPSELEEARWIGRADLADYLSRHPGRGDSIKSFLVSSWLTEGD
jgi:NADH pyrophosphatase NudC (nudix superfamily)